MAFPADWTKRAPITVAAGTVSELLSDYPQLIPVPASIYDDANADGSDIRASSDEDGTAELAVDVVSFDPVGDTAEIYVKVPSISAVADTTIYLWFGNATATRPAVDSAFGQYNVYDGGIGTDGDKAFWPLCESGNGTAGEFEDRTRNANHGQGGGGTASAVPTRVDGVVGYGQSFDGGDDIVFSPVAFSGDFTAGVWVNPASLDSIVMFIAGADNNGAYAIAYTGGSLYCSCSGVFVGQVYSLATADWTLLHVTRESNGIVFYANGQPIGSPQTVTQTLTVKRLSGWDNGTYRLTGLQDSPRIANVARSPAWIAADYASQSSPGTFASAGAVVDVGGTPVAIYFGLNQFGQVQVNFTQALP